jgi:enoyl-CoA hydratase
MSAGGGSGRLAGRIAMRPTGLEGAAPYRPTKPLIAAVEGWAIAGGTEVLQAMDIRVAGDTATFGISEVRRGLFPLGGSTVRLRRQIPYTIAAELLLTGRHVSAQEPGNRADRPRGAGAGARKARRSRPDRRERARRGAGVLRSQGDGGMSEIDGLARELESGCLAKDAMEGPRAFAEKRKPAFHGE